MIVIEIVAAYLVGWFAWTFGEYAMHRFAMHELKGRGVASREHLTHHADRDSILEKWALSWSGVVLVGVVGFGWGGSHVLPTPVAVGLAAGWIGGYGFYDWMHYRAHRHHVSTRAGFGRYERRLRLHHFHHHFGHPMRNHGVTLPLWDVVFGTYDPVTGPVRVPGRMAMTWLLDEDGAVRAAYARDYNVVGTRERTSAQAAEDIRNAFANLAPVV
jgi:sterol desaturase/sphingolipid hydroxylase (fatty acid hydroxylase superfamily)